MTDETHSEENQSQKVQHMLQLGQGQLDLEYKLFTSIDTKAIWLVTFLVTGLSLIIAHFLKFFTDLLTASIVFGIFALGSAISIIFPREFFIGSGAKKVIEKFWAKNKSVEELRRDILSNVNYATEKNKKTIQIKNFWFKVSLYLAIIFLLTFILFLFLNYELIK